MARKLPKYLQRLKKEKALAARKGGKKPRAHYQPVPIFTPTLNQKYKVFFTLFQDIDTIIPEEMNNPMNLSDETCITTRTHYIPNGFGKNKSRYVYCPKTLNMDNRCAFCEAYYASWQIKLESMDRDSQAFKALRESVNIFKHTEQNWFPIVNVTAALSKSIPDCFAVPGELNMEEEKCVKCPFQDYCHRGGFQVEAYSMPKRTKNQFDDVLAELYNIESELEGKESRITLEDDEEKEIFEGMYNDPEEGVLFSLHKQKNNDGPPLTYLKEEKRYYSAPKKIKSILKNNTIDPKAFKDFIFKDVGTYKEMLEIIPENLVEYMDEYFEQRGLDWPDGISPSSESFEFKKCLGDKNTLDVDDDECLACPLYINYCSPVVDDEKTIEEVLEELGEEFSSKKSSLNIFKNKSSKKKSKKVVEEDDEDELLPLDSEEEDEDNFWDDVEDEEEEKVVKKKKKKKTNAAERIKRKAKKARDEEE